MPPAVRRGSVQLLMGASATSSFDRFVTGPALLTIAGDFDVGLDGAAPVAALYFVLYGLGQPVWGLLSDRLGRVRTMRLALTAAAVSAALAVAAQTLPTLVVARAVGGAAMGAVVPTCLVYVGDAVPFARRQATLTDLNAATALGIASATALGGVLAATVSWRVAFAVPAAAAALVALLLGRLPEPVREHPAPARIRTVLRAPAGRTVLLLALVEGAVLLGLLTYLAPALESGGVSATRAGLVVSLYGLGLLVASRVVKRLSRTASPARLIVGGACGLVLAYAVVAVDQGPLAVAGASVLVGAGWAAMHSTMQTWATEAVPQARAVTVSLFAGALFLGSGLATAALAPPAADLRWGAVFGGAAVLAAGFGLVAALARRRFGQARQGPGAVVD